MNDQTPTPASVYLLEYDNREGYSDRSHWVCGVFSTLEKAQQFAFNQHAKETESLSHLNWAKEPWQGVTATEEWKHTDAKTTLNLEYHEMWEHDATTSSEMYASPVYVIKKMPLNPNRYIM